MKPVIALVGRPNVGKSTLFNRLTRSRDALVADIPGLTRDRKYGEGVLDDRQFIVIDTGGISGNEEGIDKSMAAQSLQAIAEADVCLFLVDARDGLTATDQDIQAYLRKNNKNSVLVVNKVDGLDEEQAKAEFYSLGMAEVFAITASHGRGVKQMLATVLDAIAGDDVAAEEAPSPDSIRITVAGRPNVGKSTLVNRMLGEDRVVVYDEPGTTRDSVYIPYTRRGQDYTLIDTAGIRRRGKTRESIEKFSVVKSLQAIKDAHVVIFIIDAREGIVEQDLHLLGYVLEAGRSLVIAINKWDGMEEDDKSWLKSEMKRRLGFVNFASMHFISALHGTGVGELYSAIHKAYRSAMCKLTTSQLNQMLERIQQDHAPPVVNNRRIKLRYAHAGGHNPPVVVVHGKQTEKLPASYKRYLEKGFREHLKLEGTPLRIELRSDENPYIKGEAKLNPQQVARKRRLKKNRKQAR